MPWRTLCGFPPTSDTITLRVPNGAWRPDTVITDYEGTEMFVLLDQTQEMRSYEAVFGDLEGRRLVCIKRHMIQAFWRDGYYFCTYKPNYKGQKPLAERDVDNKKVYPFSYLQVSPMKGRFFYRIFDNQEGLSPPKMRAENPWLGFMVVCCTPMVRCGKWTASFKRKSAATPTIHVDQWRNCVDVGPGNDLLAALCMAYVFDRYQCQPLVTIFGVDDDDNDQLEADDRSIASKEDVEQQQGAVQFDNLPGNSAYKDHPEESNSRSTNNNNKNAADPLAGIGDYGDQQPRQQQQADCDEFGNPIEPLQYYDEFGNPIEPQYDESGHPIAPLQYYDEFGNPAFDEFGNPIAPHTQPAFDEFGNPIKQHLQPAFDEFGNPMEQQLAFDEFGNPIQHQQPAFDEFGNPIEQQPAFDEFGNPMEQQLAFDEFGNPIQHQQPAFDEFGNPIEQQHTFDEFGNPIEQQTMFDEFGNPILQQHPAFDEFGIPINQQLEFDEFGNLIERQHAFDEFGNPIDQQQPAFDEFGNSIDNVYDHDQSIYDDPQPEVMQDEQDQSVYDPQPDLLRDGQTASGVDRQHQQHDHNAGPDGFDESEPRIV